MNIPINSFVLYLKHIGIIEKLTDEQAGILIKAIFRYVAENNEQQFDDPMIEIAFDVIRDQIDYCIQRYKEKATENYTKW